MPDQKPTSNASFLLNPPPRFEAPFWCRIFGHKWFDGADGWVCRKCLKREPKWWGPEWVA